MAKYRDLVFHIVNGNVTREGDMAWEDDWDDGLDEDNDHSHEPEPLTNEFRRDDDGWYWQHRRIRYFEDFGEAFGELRGPFTTEEEARSDLKANGAGGLTNPSAE
jgi:hypothetical protein